MIETIIGIAGAAVGGALAYGDIRSRIGKLEGKLDVLCKDMHVYFNGNNYKEK